MMPRTKSIMITVELNGKFKEMVYANSESELERVYNEFKKSTTARRYPQFAHHMEALWPRQKSGLGATGFCLQSR